MAEEINKIISPRFAGEEIHDYKQIKTVQEINGVKKAFKSE